MSDSSELANLIKELEEEATLALVRQRIAAGDDPLNIIQQAEAGMSAVGQRYQDGRYFIAGLIMAGEIFRQVIELTQPLVIERLAGEVSGTVLIGTVQGDIHDLGKNIMSLLLRSYGFQVHDLGVDVPPAEFVRQAAELRPDIIGLSGLLTSSYQSMKETVALLRDAYRDWPQQPVVLIGGNQLDEQIGRYVQADHWVSEAAQGIAICRQVVGA